MIDVEDELALEGGLLSSSTETVFLGGGTPTFTEPRALERLLLIDALGMKFRELKLRKNPDCPVCGTHPTITKLIDYNEFCGIRGEEKPVETLTADIQDAAGNWVDAEVQVCTNGPNTLVTSRKPDDLPAFCAQLVRTFQHQAA